MGSKKDIMSEQTEKFQLIWSSRLGGDRAKKSQFSRYFDMKWRYLGPKIEFLKSGLWDLLVSPKASVCVIFTVIDPLSCSLYNTQRTYWSSCVLKIWSDFTPPNLPYSAFCSKSCQYETRDRLKAGSQSH